MDYNLKPLQLAILDIYKEFQRICETHGFRYYAMYGTALGAVRHKGFIPWDDDFDVAMPRDDFNKFVRLVNDELPGRLRFSRGGTEPYSPIYFGQIRNIDPTIIEALSQATNLKLIHPPYMDVFVLDRAPIGRLTRFSVWGWRRLMRSCQLYRHKESAYCVSQMNKAKLLFARALGAVVSLFLPSTESNEDFMRLFDEMCALKYPSSNMFMEICFCRLRRDRLISSDELEPHRTVAFWDTRVRIPANAEGILTRYYGDFMSLPDEASRVPAHQLRVHYKEHI